MRPQKRKKGKELAKIRIVCSSNIKNQDKINIENLMDLNRVTAEQRKVSIQNYAEMELNRQQRSQKVDALDSRIQCIQINMDPSMDDFNKMQVRLAEARTELEEALDNMQLSV